MKKQSRVLLFAGFIGILSITTSFGQVPELFNYQAIVRNAENEVVASQAIAVRISILNASEELKYSEIHSLTSGDLGQINLHIGEGTVVSGDMKIIDWSSSTYFLKVEMDPENGSNFSHIGTSQLVAVPYAMHAGNVDMPLNKLEILEPEGGVNEEALFEVKREDGSTVFAVYNEGVRIFVDEEAVKGVKGGFAVGGYKSGKGYTNDYLKITPDSVRIYVNEDLEKGVKGGFAVGGYKSGKALPDDIMRITPDSVRIYVNENPAKGIKGGFAVGGYRSGKSSFASYLQLDPDNYFIGHDAGFSNTTGIFNSFFGYEAGYNNTTGELNLFQGYNSGYSNTIGVNNIFLGYNSGYSNVSGEANVFIGVEAGFSNTTGTLNAFVGNQAGYSSSTGNYNTFLGFWSGTSNTTGNLNTYLGAEAGRQALDGDLNTVVGAYAGSEYNFGWHNTFIGMRAGSYNKGNRNTILGSQAGNGNEDGNDNILIGFYSGEASVGSDNIFIGGNAGGHSSGDNNILIGKGSGFNLNRSNTLIIDNVFDADSTLALIYGETDNRVLVFNGNVGIGVYPESKLHIGGDLKIDGAFTPNGIRFEDSWDPAAEFLTSGNYISFADVGFSEDYIGYKNNAFYFLDAPGGGDTQDPHMQFGGNVYIDSGDVAIGNIVPSERLDIDGSARFRVVDSGTPAFDLSITDDGTLTTSVSDARMKTAFENLDHSLEKVLQMKAYSFEWKASESGNRDVGFKAQELQEVFPEAVFINPADGYMGINYSRLPAILVEAIKEQQELIIEKDIKIQALEERLERLEKALDLE
jgi:hypothetical protein